ncbi:MAG: hypothetical protein WC508_03400 [Patescibacteria group bacterium]
MSEVAGFQKSGLTDPHIVSAPAAVALYGNQTIELATSIPDLAVVGAVLEGGRTPVAFVVPNMNGSGEAVSVEAVQGLCQTYRIRHGIAPSKCEIVWAVPPNSVKSRQGVIIVTRCDKRGPFAKGWNEVVVKHEVGENAKMSATWRRMENGAMVEEAVYTRKADYKDNKVATELITAAFEAIIRWLSGKMTHVWWPGGKMTIAGMFSIEKKSKPKKPADDMEVTLEPERAYNHYCICVQRPVRGQPAVTWIHKVMLLAGGLVFYEPKQLSDSNGGLTAARAYFEQFPGANETLDRCMESLLRLEQQGEDRFREKRQRERQ